jgi:hypothetical protein
VQSQDSQEQSGPQAQAPGGQAQVAGLQLQGWMVVSLVIWNSCVFPVGDDRVSRERRAG